MLCDYIVNVNQTSLGNKLGFFMEMSYLQLLQLLKTITKLNNSIVLNLKLGIDTNFKVWT